MQRIDTKLTWELKLVVSIKSDCVVPENIHTSPRPLHTIQYNTIQILLSTPHGGFSETNINSTGNQKNKQTNKQANTQELSINNY